MRRALGAIIRAKMFIVSHKISLIASSCDKGKICVLRFFAIRLAALLNLIYFRRGTI